MVTRQAVDAVGDSMNDHFRMHPYLNAIRWTARFTGVALLIMVAIFTVMDGIQHLPKLLTQSVAMQVEYVAIVSVLLANLLAWRWEGLGAVVAIACYTIFCTIEFMTSGKFPFGSIIYLIPAMMFLAVWMLARRESELNAA
jgi:uncharacterized membrane protein